MCVREGAPTCQTFVFSEQRRWFYKRQVYNDPRDINNPPSVRARVPYDRRISFGRIDKVINRQRRVSRVRDNEEEEEEEGEGREFESVVNRTAR